MVTNSLTKWDDLPSSAINLGMTSILVYNQFFGKQLKKSQNMSFGENLVRTNAT